MGFVQVAESKKLTVEEINNSIDDEPKNNIVDIPKSETVTIEVDPQSDESYSSTDTNNKYKSMEEDYVDIYPRNALQNYFDANLTPYKEQLGTFMTKASRIMLIFISTL